MPTDNEVIQRNPIYQAVRSRATPTIEHDGSLTIKRVQQVDESELAYNAALREARQSGDNVKFARVPMAWIESMMARGVDVMNMEPAELMRLLRDQDLDQFITYHGRL